MAWSYLPMRVKEMRVKAFAWSLLRPFSPDEKECLYAVLYGLYAVGS